MTNNNMNIIAQALVYNKTVFHNKTATINGGQVGLDTYGTWKTAMTNAWNTFYDYEKATRSKSINADNNIEPIKDKAMESLQALLDLIGEVNGFPLRKSVEMLGNLSKYAKGERKGLAGDAEYINTQLKNLRKQFSAPHNGASEEWIADMEKQIASKEEELALAKKQAGSADKGDKRIAFSTFAHKVETELAKIIVGQELTPREVLEAEEEARKAAKREARKAKRQANKK